MGVVQIPFKRVILVTGPVADLSLSNKEKIGKTLEKLCDGYPYEEVCVMHGNAVGVDKYADEWARGSGCHTRTVDYYRRYGKIGGFLRNQEMCITLAGYNFLGFSVVVAAFPSRDFPTSGTQNCMAYAEVLKLPIYEEPLQLRKVQVRMRKR